MKHIFSIIFALALMLPPLSVSAEVISNFSSFIEIDSDSTITVTESITYDFGDVQRHGIFRDILYKYDARGGNYNLRVEVQSVTDAQGNAQPYTDSVQGEYRRIKIGDPDIYVSGEQTYVITYQVARAINYFDSHDELFWNVTGDEWGVPIQQASVTITPPKNSEITEVRCFTGTHGSTEQNCLSEQRENSVQISIADPLAAYEGFSAVIALPQGSLARPGIVQNILWFLEDNWALFIPLLVFAGMYYLWYTKGRDEGQKRVIIPQYEPTDDLTPSEIGALIDEKVDTKDITVILINLAVKGYIKIKRTEEKKFIGTDVEYEFIKLKNADSVLPTFEKEFMKDLFDGAEAVLLSDLKDSFYQYIPEIKKKLYSSIVDKGYFSKNPSIVRNSYLVFASILFFASFFVAFKLTYLIAGLASAAIIFVFSFIMPAKTIKGRRAREHALGYKLFLGVTERDRAAFHFDPNKNPELFEKYLPYAVVFGVEKEWADQFKDIITEPPNWYEGPRTGFNAVVFSSLIHDMDRSFASTATSRPSNTAAGGGSGFSSGGFSGGGFGGGGGGSW